MKKYSVADWYDDIFKDYTEFMTLAETADVEFEKIYSELRRWIKNLTPAGADKDGIERFEKLLKITPQPTDTLEDRRYRVMVKYNTRLPYTENQLRLILDEMLGKDGYRLSIKALKLVLSLSESNNNKVQILYELLNEITPVNILLELHQYLKRDIGYYQGAFAKIGNHLYISPYTVESIDVDASHFASGYLKITNRIRIL